MLLLNLFLLIPAAWRLSALLTREDMPFHLLEWLRYKVDKTWVAIVVGGVDTPGCVKCMSMYVAAFLLLMCHLSPYGWWLVYVLALSAITIAIEEVTR